MKLLPLKTHKLHIVRNVESTTVPANGGRRTILKIEDGAGTLKQISFRTTQLTTEMHIRVDDEYTIEFPTVAQIITNHVMTTPYSPECFFAHKSAASPYGLTSTYKIDFEKSIEVVCLVSGTTAATVTDGFLVADLCTEEFIKENAW